MNNKEKIAMILEKFEERGITVWCEAEKLKYKAPKNFITPDDIKLLKDNKEDIISVLQAGNLQDSIIRNPNERNFPFALTDVQSAYLLGRKNYFEYGGVSCRIYLELEYDELDPVRVQEIWNALIQRHDMLRAVINEEGYQSVMKKVPEYQIEYGVSDNDLIRIRQNLSDKYYDISQWPLFDVAVTNLDKKAIMHFSIEFLIADWASIWLLFSEFEKLYYMKEELKDIDLTFRDYLVAERKIKESANFAKDKTYWMNRVDSLPGAPELPIENQINSDISIAGFERYYFKLANEEWEKLKNNAQKQGVTPTAAVMSAYATVIEKWSKNSRFCLNLTVLNRLPLDRQVNDVVGDFTSVNLLEVNWNRTENFSQNAKRLNQQLFNDLDHRLYSGVEMLREIARRKQGETILMPIVFTSAIGLIQQTQNPLVGRYTGNGISQTPQVFIDCQAMDNQDGLQINWDVRKGVFPENLVNDMFQTFIEIIERLAASDNFWLDNLGVEIPKWQIKELNMVNDTQVEFKEQYLFTGIYDYYIKNPNKVAVIDSINHFTYKNLVLRASSLIYKLKQLGCDKGDRIAIMMEKNAFQMVAVLGVVGMGAVYVPIDIQQPEKRWKQILYNTQTRVLLSTSNLSINIGDETKVIFVDQLLEDKICRFEDLEDYEAPAYIIHTSGTTGVPKGVVINHKAAMNTIMGINKKFNVSEYDKVLGLAKLSFDLSVYDCFGILSVGGTLVYPDVDKQVDPSHWASLMKEYGITIWNSVPALMQMLVSFLHSEKEYSLPSFRLALLSGDWISVKLPNDLQALFPELMVVSLGGATEASIWSIFYVIDEISCGWKSVPYGHPLPNQTFYILDENLFNCPYWCIGELCIGGNGLSDGYYGDEALTHDKFIMNREGKRIYRTGDMGRYRPGGVIEFLGRQDNQVKIKGHRIELGEIESALLKCEEIRSAAVIVKKKGAEQALIAFVEMKGIFNENIARDIKLFLEDYIPKYMIPSDIVILEKMPLSLNEKLDRNALATIEINHKSENNKMDTNDNTGLGNTVLELWRDALNEESLSAKDNFYEFGADSLIMAQMAGKLKDNLKKEPWKVEIPFDSLLRQMINYPTTWELTKFIEESISDSFTEENCNKIKDSSYAVLKASGNDDSNKLKVLIHGGLGTTSCYRYVIPFMEKEDDSKIVCVNIANTDNYCSLHCSEAIEILANEYSEMLMALNKPNVQVIGYSLGGLLALEVARRLSEMGANIEDIVLIDIPPMLYDIKDELIVELLFTFNLNIKMEQIGLWGTNTGYISEALKETLKSCDGNIPEKLQLIRNGVVDYNLNREINKIRELGRKRRFEMYQEAMGTEKMPIEMLEDLYRIFRQSLRIANYEPQPYFGDIRFLQAKEPFNLWTGNQEKTIQFWQQITLGELKVNEIEGNHFSCVESKENAKRLSELLLNY